MPVPRHRSQRFFSSLPWELPARFARVTAEEARREGGRAGGRGERPESARGGWSANDIGVVGHAEVNEADAATQRNDEGRGLTDLSEC